MGQDKDWVTRNFTTDGCYGTEGTGANTTAPVPNVSSIVTVTGGSWQPEVRWSITCGGVGKVTEDQGRAPYS